MCFNYMLCCIQLSVVFLCALISISFTCAPVGRVVISSAYMICDLVGSANMYMWFGSKSTLNIELISKYRMSPYQSYHTTDITVPNYARHQN